MGESEWIYTSDELPKIYKYVLCYYVFYSFTRRGPRHKYCVGYYADDNIWYSYLTGERLKVIAWQPLPDPPEKR